VDLWSAENTRRLTWMHRMVIRFKEAFSLAPDPTKLPANTGLRMPKPHINNEEMPRHRIHHGHGMSHSNDMPQGPRMRM
jgi:hypothetical protein